MAKTAYSAESIQVLTGLEPVRKRPGMYTDTARPNHLVQEVVDNSVDEALAGHARRIEVVLEKGGAVAVRDDGRGMPVDVHPEHGVSGVELILTRLHAGGKFSDENYRFSGGLHGVGVSVVNALASWLEVEVLRDGQRWRQRFEGGVPQGALEAVEEAPRRRSGTTVRFSPDASFFDSANISRGRLTHLLRAKAVLCPGLEILFTDEANGSPPQRWCYENGLKAYLEESTQGLPSCPQSPFCHEFSSPTETISWAVQWLPEGGELLQESYVNLIPTAQGGTHVNGSRFYTSRPRSSNLCSR